MAIRNTTHILKNSDIVNRPLPSSLYKGEAIVNTADGIMYFSGVTTSTSGWTQSNPSTPTFWEVGSNLYDLNLRNKIASYSGVTNLSGKFLSGTTSGFVLADITAIVGVDTFVTGFTYSNNFITLTQNIGGYTPLTVDIGTMTGLTVNGALSATTGNIGTINTTTLNATGGTITTLGSTTINANQVNATAATITTLSSTTINAGNLGLTGGITSYSGTANVAGQFLSGTTNGFVLGAISAITGVDTFVTGFTYTPSTNTFTILNNLGSNYPAQFNSVSGLSFSNLTAGRVVYVGTGSTLTDEAGFTYDDSTNTFSVPNDGTVNVGTGGLNVAGSAVIQGSLTVFGPSISAFTSELYVEDKNITLNYNPTGNTTATSVGAGWTIQDGSGIANTATTFNIGLSYLNSNLSPNTEYTSSTGNLNRNIFTQVGDIIIRNTNYDENQPDGVRVLTEGNVLNGGLY